jgi:hypothetical protein
LGGRDEVSSGRSFDAGGGNDAPDSDGLDAKLDRAVPTSEAEAFLVRVGGDQGGRVFPLTHNTAIIGRLDHADVYVADSSVSARHAQIINGSHGFEIEDLGSTNGTFVEGQRVTRTRLRSGDRIVLGQVEFKFLVDRRVDATMTIIPAGLPAGNRREAGLMLYQPPVSRPPAFPNYSNLPNFNGMPGMPSMPNGAGMPPPAAQKRDDDEGLSLEELIARLAIGYRFLQQNRRLIAFFAGIGVVIGLISTVLLPPPGQAQCILKLQPQIKANPVDAQWSRQSLEDQDMRFFADAETAFVQPELVQDTLRKLTNRTPSDATITSFSERLRLEPEPDHTYKATYREQLMGQATPTATQFLKAHLDNYIHGEIDRAIHVFSAQADFLRDQLKSVEGEMKRISGEKMQFRQKNSDRLPEEAGQMLGSRFDLESRRAELTAQVRKLQGELDARRHALADEGPLAQRKLHESEVYRQSLADLNRKLSEAYARGLADEHPDVIQIKDEKKRLEGLIQKEMSADTSAVDRKSNAGYQDLQNQVALLQGQLNAARSDLADTERSLGHLQNVVGDLPRVQAGVQQLTHLEEATTQLHGQLFEQLKKAELQVNLERVSAESRYEVLVPVRLYKSGRARTAALRAGAGLFLGLFLALATIIGRKGRELLSRALMNLDARSMPYRR